MCQAINNREAKIHKKLCHVLAVTITNLDFTDDTASISNVIQQAQELLKQRTFHQHKNVKKTNKKQEHDLEAEY